jgi:hypothetical protein
MLPGWIRVYRLVFGVTALVAVFRNYVQLDDPYFWRFFTNQSSLIAGVVLIFGSAFFARRHAPLWWDIVRGTAVLMMLITGIVYATLLDGIYNPLDGSHRWESSVMHQLLPVVMVIELFLVPLHRRVPMWSMAALIAYPLLWLGYTVRYGLETGWYPYDFLDPAQNGGATGVTITVGILIAVFLLFASLIIRLGRVVRRGAGVEPITGHVR